MTQHNLNITSKCMKKDAVCYILQKIKFVYYTNTAMSFADEYDDPHRKMPISSEFYDADHYQYLPLKKLIAKIRKHQLSSFRCRCIGVFSCRGHTCILHDIDDSSIELRVSLSYLKAELPYMAEPFTAQIFGHAHWHCGIGPVLYVGIFKVLDPPLAQKLARTMKWVVENTYLTQR